MLGTQPSVASKSAFKIFGRAFTGVSSWMNIIVPSIISAENTMWNCVSWPPTGCGEN
jgi:hypothetical protein